MKRRDKMKELRNMELSELQARLEELEEELFRLRFQSVVEDIKSPSLVRQKRRDIARIKTVIREGELAGKFPPHALRSRVRPKVSSSSPAAKAAEQKEETK
ncbi:MAG: 50S ribosomal protein L29 [Planctomycetota bacterium]|nr:MAG: 50S ribosomal protein L29 [Planctomycetota bacterium]